MRPRFKITRPLLHRIHFQKVLTAPKFFNEVDLIAIRLALDIREHREATGPTYYDQQVQIGITNLLPYRALQDTNSIS